MQVLKHRHFLQSDEWAQFQQALGRQVETRSGEGWRYVAIVEEGYGKLGPLNRRLYTPYGPTFNSKRSLQEALDDLEKLATTKKVSYVRVDPTGYGSSPLDIPGLDQFGYKRNDRPSQPPLTLLIDLGKSFDEVMQGFSKTNRYLWRKADKLGLSFETTYEVGQIQPFLDMMKATSARTGAVFYDDNYYRTLLETLGSGKTAGICYAHHSGEPVASIFFIDDQPASTRYYLYAASFDKARNLNAMPTLVMYCLKSAQELGLETFDFFGIEPLDSTNTARIGFTKFKRSFGGTEQPFLGTWEKPVNHRNYFILQLLRKIRY